MNEKKPRAIPKSTPEEKLTRSIFQLVQLGAHPKTILEKFAEKTLKLFNLDALMFIYHLAQEDYKLLFVNRKEKKWQEVPKKHLEFLNWFSGSDWLSSSNLKKPEEIQKLLTSFSYQPDSFLGFARKKRGKPELALFVFGKNKNSLKNLEFLGTLLKKELGFVCENARLEEMNQQMEQRSQTILTISQILNSSLSPKIVRTRAMEAVVQLLGCEAGSLYLIDEERGELFFEVALGEGADRVKEIRLKIGEGVAGWVAKTGKPALIPDVSKDPRWFRKADKKSKWQTRNMITVPVKSKGKVIGVLQALNKLGGKSFDEQDLKLMQSLADQVAIALENARLYEEQKQTFFQTAEALATAIEKRDPYTGGHTKRVSDFSIAIGEEMGLSPEELENLKLSAILHDIGKIGVEDRILRKPGKLTKEEFLQMSTHPEQGYEIISHIRSLEPVIPGMRYHHERPDGKGYPAHLKGKEIPLLARIIAVADCWDALTSDRPYRPALDEARAIKEMLDNQGKQFDPQTLQAFFQAYLKGKIYTQHRPPGTPPPKNVIKILTAPANQNKLKTNSRAKGGKND